MSNFIKRCIVGSLLGIIVIIAIFVNNPLLILLLTLIWVGFATNEFLHILSLKNIQLSRFLIILLNLTFPVLFYFTKSFILFLLLPVVVFIYALLKNEQYYLVVPFSVFTLFYLGFLASHLLFLKIWAIEQNLSFWIVFFPVLFTWVNDTFAYAVGTLFVKVIRWSHKLAAQISPNKTIEGFLGGLIVSVVFSVFFLKHFYPNIHLLITIFLGLVLSVSAQVADLVESGFKRAVNLKDSSNIFPGHGGFLDRIDSLLLTVPVFYYFLRYIISIFY
ncbi:MAG: phosphatidate cytidylyltransferase [candidate division WOR-3 bacterium]|nr:phosphatidate cytidylyltransferase [candidate division WOR-3 bacterium]